MDLEAVYTELHALIPDLDHIYVLGSDGEPVLALACLGEERIGGIGTTQDDAIQELRVKLSQRQTEKE